MDERDLGYVIGSCPTIPVGVACECYSIVDGSGVSYGLILRPFSSLKSPIDTGETLHNTNKRRSHGGKCIWREQLSSII